jgi:hypothetical protein
LIMTTILFDEFILNILFIYIQLLII